jgi:hypothetical protein
MSEIQVVQLGDGRWAAKRDGLVFLIAHTRDELERRLEQLYPEEDTEPWQWRPGPYWRF